MPLPVLVKMLPQGAGSKIGPLMVAYGCSISATFGEMQFEVAAISSRNLWMRYSALVMVTTSGGGKIVTVVVTTVTVPSGSITMMVKTMITGGPSHANTGVSNVSVAVL